MMRRILLLFVILSGLLTATAQNKVETLIPGETITYRHIKYDHNPRREYLSNSGNVLEGKEPNYRFDDPKVRIGDELFVDSLIYRYIYPEMKNNLDLIEDGIDVPFLIYFFAPPDGKVRELLFSYDGRFPLPITAVENLEKALLGGNLQILFDRNQPTLKGVQWTKVWTYRGCDKDDLLKWKLNPPGFRKPIREPGPPSTLK